MGLSSFLILFDKQKHWKNLSGPGSKYKKNYVKTDFKSSRNLTDVELEQARAAHEEGVRTKNLALFTSRKISKHNRSVNVRI